MGTVRLTMAQALVRHLAAQWTEDDEGRRERLFAGCWAIFGHGNVAGMGEALYAHREELPTLRAHNEQAMALSAVAYAKAKFRRRMMAVTTSIGPGATNLVTAAALAHVDRLPVLLLPGDIYASRRPDPVLQQVEDFGDGTVSANDCFRPVSRYFDRITRPEQILTALPRAGADEAELAQAVAALKKAERPLVIAGGGVLYSGAAKALAGFAERHGLPVAETQAGKGSLAWNHPANAGSIGVTGSSAANALAVDADVVLAVGTRLQDFTTGSRALFRAPGRTLIQLNAAVFDAGKHGALPLVADARRGLDELSEALGSWTAPKAQSDRTRGLIAEWTASVDRATAASNAPLPSDAQVLGAVNRSAGRGAIVVCASGGLPGELHKLWRTDAPGGYHLEYGYSCMGYEIAGGLGVKLARPDREVYVLVGDGSYMMMNSEIATAVQQGVKLTIVVLDNRGFGCINRLQNATGGASFNNLFRDIEGAQPIDFALHAASMGAVSEKVSGIAELEGALLRAKATDQTTVIVVDTDPVVTTEAGGAWWDVAVPEVSDRDPVRRARAGYEEQLAGHPVTGHDA
ncbi:MAG: 3D-(3,5/4)-trihydroxycyclohexane-1,2-dione acylhydrolase (decyclizing) [Inquilinus limosus]|uniref:3D-(3,5/4)-trihydroxycyclohexane-1,2-dione acylhydrolase (Decyclizing) n=1 Tax=Inquilinus limosus TaxID=171674 RepID=A0A952FP52_9PROT|nr:3D-(3,5/4)-trihydroxycyclohexane-1,2-dione acylhydrolase (decyclizing) [Inquilinus limosus]